MLSLSSEKMAPDSFSYKKKQKEKAVIVGDVQLWWDKN